MGMFSQESLGPELSPFESIRQRGKRMADRTAPYLREKFGYESQERELRRVASETDLSDGKAVQKTYNFILSKNPTAANSWLKSVMPTLKANIEQQQLAASSSKSAGFKPKDIFDNIRKDYDKIFCASQGVLGGGCSVPSLESQIPAGVRKNLVRGEDEKYILPNLSEFARLNYGEEAYNIVQTGLGKIARGEIPAEFKSTDTSTTDSAPATDSDFATSLAKDREELERVLKQGRTSLEDLKKEAIKKYGQEAQKHFPTLFEVQKYEFKTDSSSISDITSEDELVFKLGELKEQEARIKAKYNSMLEDKRKTDPYGTDVKWRKEIERLLDKELSKIEEDKRELRGYLEKSRLKPLHNVFTAL